jgi:hypothetical protein
MTLEQCEPETHIRRTFRFPFPKPNLVNLWLYGMTRTFNARANTSVHVPE